MCNLHALKLPSSIHKNICWNIFESFEDIRKDERSMIVLLKYNTKSAFFKSAATQAVAYIMCNCWMISLTNQQAYECWI